MVSIKTKVMILALLMTIPVVLLGLAGTLYYQGIIKQNIWDDDLAQAKAISAMTTEYVGADQIYLKSIADRPLIIGAVENRDTSYLNSIAVYANNSSRINSVYFTDKNGIVMAATPELSGLMRTNMSYQPYVWEALHTGSMSMGDAEPGWNGMPGVAMGIPVKSDNMTVIGVIVGTVDLDDFSATILSTLVKNQQYVYLVNRTGHIFIHNNRQYVLNMTDYSTVPAVQNVLRGETGVIENYNSIEHSQRLAAYTPVSSMGWGVIVAMPVSVAYQPITTAMQWMLAIITAFTILSLLLGLYVSHGIADPITRLSTAVKMAGENEDYRSMLPLNRDDEIGELAHSFDSMVNTIKHDIGELKRTGEALRKGQYILAKSQEVARLGNWAWNVPTGVLTGSPENDRIFGYEPGSVKVTTEWVLSRIVEDDRQIFKDSMDLASREGKRVSVDYRITRPDGKIRYINTIVDKIVRDISGNIKWIYGISQDITERKQAEENMKEAKQRAELYLDLMGHDINNINQIAMGYLEIARDQLSLSEDEKELIITPLEALRSSASLIENVRKLQHVKEADLKTEMIDIGAILSSLRDEYMHTASRNLEIYYEPVDGCRVIATGLLRDVFSNLIGNAIKHSEGRTPIRINIKQDTTVMGGKKYCRIAIEDNGPGIPDALKPKLFHRFQRGDTRAHGKGMGLYLVRTLVEDYHGKAWVEDRVPGDPSKGARFVVILPLVENIKDN